MHVRLVASDVQKDVALFVFRCGGEQVAESLLYESIVFGPAGFSFSFVEPDTERKDVRGAYGRHV